MESIHLASRILNSAHLFSYFIYFPFFLSFSFFTWNSPSLVSGSRNFSTKFPRAIRQSEKFYLSENKKKHFHARVSSISPRIGSVSRGSFVFSCAEPRVTRRLTLRTNRARVLVPVRPLGIPLATCQRQPDQLFAPSSSLADRSRNSHDTLGRARAGAAGTNIDLDLPVMNHAPLDLRFLIGEVGGEKLSRNSAAPSLRD